MQPFEMFTGRISDWRKWENTDVLFLDVTLMSGDKVFAPSPDLLWPYKRGEINDAEYTSIFYRTINHRINNDDKPWNWLLRQGRVCLACYCAEDKFCHRHLLERPLRYLCHQQHIPFIRHEEFHW